MKFSEEAIARWYKGNGIKKISPLDRDIKFEPLDEKAVARVNERVRSSVKQSRVLQPSDVNGLDEVFKE